MHAADYPSGNNASDRYDDGMYCLSNVIVLYMARLRAEGAADIAQQRTSSALWGHEYRPL